MGDIGKIKILISHRERLKLIDTIIAVNQEYAVTRPGRKRYERPVGIRAAHVKEDRYEWRYFAKLNTF